MATMKQLWWTHDREIELKDVEIPAVKPNEVKIKMAYAAICASDVHQVEQNVMGAQPPAPLAKIKDTSSSCPKASSMLTS